MGTSQEAVTEATTAEEPADNELGEGEVGVEASDFLEVYEGEDIGGEEEEEEEGDEEEVEEEEQTGKTVAVETDKLATVAPEVVLIVSDDDEEEEEEEEGEEGEYEDDGEKFAFLLPSLLVVEREQFGLHKHDCFNQSRAHVLVITHCPTKTFQHKNSLTVAFVLNVSFI